MRDIDLMMLCGTLTIIFVVLLVWAFCGFKTPDFSYHYDVILVEPAAGMPDQHYTYDDGPL